MAENTPTADKATFKCHPRRHMKAEFLVYDAIAAMAWQAYSGTDDEGNPKPKRKPGDVLSFYGKIKTLVNHTNVSRTQVQTHLDTLVEKGWLIKCEPPDGGVRERDAKGHLKPVMYIVIAHEDYVPPTPKHKCPPFKYNEDSERHEKKEQPIEFRVWELMKHTAGKIALALVVGSKKIPAKDFKGIVDYFRQHPEEFPKKLIASTPGIPGKDGRIHARISGQGPSPETRQDQARKPGTS